MANKRRAGKHGGYLLRSDEAAAFIGVTPKTFRRYRDLLGIQPRKIYRVPGKFYLFPDVLKIIDLYAPPTHLWVKSLAKRLQLWEEREKIRNLQGEQK
jgi:hypothetical protein